MIWKDVIAFTDKNTPYRFKVSTFRAENSDECKISVEELNEFDAKVDSFDFILDIKQDMPEADYKFHDKPIQVLISQMLSVHDNPGTW